MLSNDALIVVFCLLVVLSGCFSAAETAMMALNRYRLAHWVRSGKRRAKLVERLLQRPDRLLGVILIGNTFANILAASVATSLAVQWFGDFGVLLATAVVTIVVLICSEILPKTLAARYPGRLALLAAWPLKLLLRVLYPLVWAAGGLVNALLNLFGARVGAQGGEEQQLTTAELHSAVYTSKQVPQQRQQMLLRVLELESIHVEDVMVPRSNIAALDLRLPFAEIEKRIRTTRYSLMPVYEREIEHTKGILDTKRLWASLLSGKVCDLQLIQQHLQDSYFIPAGMPISTQLIEFQKTGRQQALVVDEYGEVLGLLSMSDIVQEVIGQWTNKIELQSAQNSQQKSIIVSGKLDVRELNRRLDWQLPTTGARTLGGLIVDFLQAIPEGPLCLNMYGHRFEVMEVRNKRIMRVRVFMALDN